MRRVTPFDRDFANLHGRRLRAREFIRHEDVRDGRVVDQVDEPAARLAIGAFSLFWALAIGAALLAMVVVGGIFLWALFTPAQLPTG